MNNPTPETNKMRPFTRIKSLILLAMVLLLVINLYPSFFDNVQRIRASQAYFVPSAVDTSANQLRQILKTTCRKTSEAACAINTDSSNKSILEIADRIFIEEQDPLIVIEDLKEIPATKLLPFGPSAANQVEPNSGTLFSSGFFQMRVFLAAEANTCWRFSVKAMNDNPPPVILTLWLDNEEIGELSFDKGDQSWETLAVYSYARPKTYWFRVWFVNDYLDQASNADRNAYIEAIEIARVEEALCEGK